MASRDHAVIVEELRLRSQSRFDNVMQTLEQLDGEGGKTLLPALRALDPAQLHASFQKIESVFASLSSEERTEMIRARSLYLVGHPPPPSTPLPNPSVSASIMSTSPAISTRAPMAMTSASAATGSATTSSGR